MNALAPASRSRAAFVLYLLLWAWMVALSALVLVNFRVAGDLAGQNQLDSAVRQLQVLEGRIAELADDVQAQQARPEAASSVALQDARQRLEAEIARLEQSLTGFAASSRRSARLPRAHPQRLVPPGPRRRLHRSQSRFPFA